MTTNDEFRIEHKKSYNGIIGNMTAKLDEHSRRLDDVEECIRDDHDMLIKLISDVETLEGIMEQHLEFHKELERRSFTLKHGIILISFQILANMLMMVVLSRLV